ncbi:hypothetical protein [Pseudomonas sp. NA-150]|uniref:hypothetical protein n=1 Tax=Pseudomonas sp. NA-150 TaxID=3367525 RepID=UPI0037C55C95
MERLQEVCARREGVCLTEEYAGYSTMHRFRCKAGHEWEALAAAVLRGSWCRSCLEARKTVVLDLAAAQQHARYYGGECVSTEYVEAPGDMQWACGFGHSWWASFASIKRSGRWCVQCSMGSRSSLQKWARHHQRNGLDK